MERASARLLRGRGGSKQRPLGAAVPDDLPRRSRTGRLRSPSE